MNEIDSVLPILKTTTNYKTAEKLYTMFLHGFLKQRRDARDYIVGQREGLRLALFPELLDAADIAIDGPVRRAVEPLSPKGAIEPPRPQPQPIQQSQEHHHKTCSYCNKP